MPVPTGSTNFEEAPEKARVGTTPLEMRQPLGPSFQVANGEVTWQNWHFRFRLDPRVGPVINLAGFEDNGHVRSVLYQGSLSELFVPYMDPAEGWATRVFLDAGEFFPMGVLSALREGIDCPADASYFDALYSDEQGIPVLQSKRACLYKIAPGQPTWRHFEKNEVWGRPSRLLVLRTTLVIGNYDYLIDWRFGRDGSIQVAVGATGIIEVKPVKEKAPAKLLQARRRTQRGDGQG